MLILRDRQGLTNQIAFVPPALALLLSLCDGTRDLAALRSAYELRTGLVLTPAQLEDLVEQLDGALMLDSPRFAEVQAAALAEFRSAPARPPVLAGHAYPAEPAACRRALIGYGSAASCPPSSVAGAGDVRGILSPHIDYERGGPVYAAVWGAAAAAVARAEVVVVFGTDHCGGAGRLTLTRQHYATPFGTLETDVEAVDAVAAALGEEAAFGEELHHRGEHSIELAAVWLHHVLEGRACRIVPVLCGSFQRYVEGAADLEEDGRVAAALAALRRATEGRRTVVVAAADLAHVGPAFGDERPFGPAERQALELVDRRTLETICAGDASAFFGVVAGERDRWRVCGLPPIYMALRFLGGGSGEVVGYEQCPADQAGGSWVSVAGVVLR